MLFRYVIMGIVFFIGHFTAKCYDFNYKNYSQAQGLTSNTVTQIFQDHHGFIWMGTPDGLNRFDGMGFTRFVHNPSDSTSLSNNEIRFIFEDNQNKLWVGTRYGLSQFDRLTETFTNFYFSINEKDSSVFDVVHHRTSNLRFYAYFAPGDNSIWLSSDYSELLHFNLNANRAKRYRPYHNTSASIIRAHSPGKLWIGTSNNGLLLFDYNNHRIIKSYLGDDFDTKQKAHHILSIEAYGDASFLVGTNGSGLYQYNCDSDEFTKIITSSSLERNNLSPFISSIIHLGDHTYLLGTDGAGIQTLDMKTATLIESTRSKTINQLISNLIIRTLFVDRDKNLWTGNYHGGANVIEYFPNNQIVHIKPSENVTNFSSVNMVTSLMTDERGRLWAGTDAGNINVYNSDYSLHKTIPGPVPASGQKNAILSLYQDSDHQIWVGSYLMGLSKIDTLSQSFQNYTFNAFDEHSIPHNDVRDIIEDSQNRLWVGTNGGGIGILDKRTNRFITISQSKHGVNPEGRIYCDYIVNFHRDKQDNIWISTINGLYLYQDKTDRIYHIDLDINGISLNGKEINSVLQKNESDFFIGTSVGLFKLRLPNGLDEKIYLEAPEQKLVSTNIKSMLLDESGALWLGQNNGITRFDEKTQTIEEFNRRHGFQLEGCHVNAALTHSSGSLCFGGINGFNVFSPDQMKLDGTVSEVIITNIEVVGKEIATVKEVINNEQTLQSIHDLKKITLSSKDYILKLEFVAPNYTYPEYLKYIYRLDGFDPEGQWTSVNARQRTVTYTNLQPGEYNFQVKASNHNNIWSDKTTSLKIVITPPFWKTKTFYFLIMLTMAGSLMLLRNSILTRERQRALKHKIEHENELIQQKFKFFTNISHEIRTPLTLIIEPLKRILNSEENPDNENSPQHQHKENLTLIYKNAVRLHRMVDQLIDFRKMEAGVMPLNILENDMVSFIRETCSLFSLLVEQKHARLTFQTAHKKILMPFDRDKLEKVLLNLLSNALKFSLDEAKVIVSLDIVNAKDTQQFVCISVKDHGIGIPSDELENIFKRFYQVKQDNFCHYGSGIGLSFVKEIMDLMSGEIKVKSEVGKGTKFQVLLPLYDHKIDESETLEEHIFLNAIPENVKKETIKTDDPKRVRDMSPERDSILLVEDNIEIRKLICQELGGDFDIQTAEDGRDGLLKARTSYPSLIISDIMMPFLDGYALCKALKTDENTCHIPVILLSAKSSEESMIEGYEIGADEYIGKPFSSIVLKTRVKNLIENRKALRNRFLKEIDILPSEITQVKKDDRLLNKLIQIVEQNCHSSAFNSEVFGQIAGMSRSVLYAKLKALTGQTVADFIKIIRLKMAAKLLRRQELSIQEISEKCGYKHVSHFSKSFSEYFGVSPSRFLEKTEIESSETTNSP